MWFFELKYHDAREVLSMINKDFLESLSPVEIQMVHQYIGVLFKDRIKDDTSNFDNLKAEKCPCCGSRHFVRNGHDPKSGRQRYMCKQCHSSFKDSTNTFFSHSRVSYNTWITFIGCEVVGLSLRQEEAICGVSKTGCFNMRHRLYHALSEYQDSRKLEGLCEIDCAYTSINLKGWKRDMPRHSKKRGKHKPDKNHKQLRGISHHKICLLTAIDENDHILFKIAGTREEDLKKYQSFADRFCKKSTLICDEKQSIACFVRKNRFGYDYIPSGSFKSDKGNTLSSINQFHQEFSELIRRKHGVGTRHLQSYMDFLVVTKELKYKLELKKMNTRLYMDIIDHPIFWTSDDICHIPMPVDVYEVYKEYGYADPRSLS
jgi:transposase-like protein